MRKIGILALTLVLALGALGIGYASWQDTITITGSVNTGSLDLVVEEYSGMWMWKVPGGTPDWELSTDPAYEPEGVGGYGDPFIVAYASAAQTVVAQAPVDDAVTVTFDNLFPLDQLGPWGADFIVEYEGTIPVIVTAAFTGSTGDAEWLWDNGYAYVAFHYVTWDDVNDVWVIGDLITGPVQLHGGEHVLCVLCVDIPQDPDPAYGYTQADFMSLNGTFDAVITAIQWNHYVP
jgi:hypothetical protein